MMPTRPTPWLRFVTAAVLLAGGIALAPAKAAAACGDYVVIASHDGASAQGPSDPALPRLPCHGPGCSNRPIEPEQPLTAPITVSTQAKDCSARMPDAVPPRDSGCVVSLISDRFT